MKISKDDALVKLVNIGKRYSGENSFFWALRNVSIEIKAGERVGIFGPNGAGKSTLLKILAGVTTQTEGNIVRKGKVILLSDLNTGFHPELSGLENIELNGMLIGMSKSEIQSKIKEIVDFANLGNYLHEPFYTYSSGMKFRLAFAVAIVSKADLIVLDEFFLTGDESFQIKSIKKLLELQKSQKKIATIVASHMPAFIWGVSSKFYLIEKGRVINTSRVEARKRLKSSQEKWHKAFNINL